MRPVLFGMIPSPPPRASQSPSQPREVPVPSEPPVFRYRHPGLLTAQEGYGVHDKPYDKEADGFYVSDTKELLPINPARVQPDGAEQSNTRQYIKRTMPPGRPFSTFTMTEAEGRRPVDDVPFAHLQALRAALPPLPRATARDPRSGEKYPIYNEGESYPTQASYCIFKDGQNHLVREKRESPWGEMLPVYSLKEAQRRLIPNEAHYVRNGDRYKFWGETRTSSWGERFPVYSQAEKDQGRTPKESHYVRSGQDYTFVRETRTSPWGVALPVYSGIEEDKGRTPNKPHYVWDRQGYGLVREEHTSRSMGETFPIYYPQEQTAGKTPKDRSHYVEGSNGQLTFVRGKYRDGLSFYSEKERKDGVIPPGTSYHLYKRNS